jgi:hypothetical protein
MAVQLLYERGYHTTSVKDIAKMVGIAQSPVVLQAVTLGCGCWYGSAAGRGVETGQEFNGGRNQVGWRSTSDGLGPASTCGSYEARFVPMGES